MPPVLKGQIIIKLDVIPTIKLNGNTPFFTYILQRQIQGEGGTGVFFCNHFEELQTVLFEVELIVNNKTLTYVYPNTIKTCFTPNHLIFDRQLSQHQL